MSHVDAQCQTPTFGPSFFDADQNRDGTLVGVAFAPGPLPRSQRLAFSHHPDRQPTPAEANVAPASRHRMDVRRNRPLIEIGI